MLDAKLRPLAEKSKARTVGEVVSSLFFRTRGFVFWCFVFVLFWCQNAQVNHYHGLSLQLMDEALSPLLHCRSCVAYRVGNNPLLSRICLRDATDFSNFLDAFFLVGLPFGSPKMF